MSAGTAQATRSGWRAKTFPWRAASRRWPTCSAP
jgi:hypothetical protein